MTQPDCKNSFKGRNSKEVWKELLQNSKPISREEFNLKAAEAAEQYRKKPNDKE